ncbi:MAG TPA: TetR/AcrR family transcriptional regulator [Candidatus Acidoferrales bacterium]|nr:TetR/AcrR family transcriptional regulator [Candidatus Acidoferrales bacterium]
MIQKAARSRGRPRSFDENTAIAKATQVFWQKGYDGVTVDDLVAEMGVGRPSLYSIFGSKREIFMRVLQAYAERKGALSEKALLSPPTLRQAIASFLRFGVTSATEQRSASGCLLMCIAPVVDDPEVRQFLQKAERGALEMVQRRFSEAIAAGEIPSDFPVAARASQVLDLVRGLTMRAQLGTSRKKLLHDAKAAADLVLPP